MKVIVFVVDAIAQALVFVLTQGEKLVKSGKK